MKKIYLAVAVIAAFLLVCKMIGLQISRPPIRVFQRHDANGHLDVYVFNNSHGTLFDVRCELERYPLGSSEEHVRLVLQIEPNGTAKITEADLGNWAIGDALIRCSARGYVFNEWARVAASPNSDDNNIPGVPAVTELPRPENAGFIDWLENRKILVQKNTWLDDTWTIHRSQVTNFVVDGVGRDAKDHSLAATVSFQAKDGGKGIECKAMFIYEDTEGDKVKLVSFTPVKVLKIGNW